MISLSQGVPLEIETREPDARLMLIDGICSVSNGRLQTVLRSLQFLDLYPGSSEFSCSAQSPTASAILLEGNWQGRLGGCGIFEYSDKTPMRNNGDPVSYEKSTTFDSHYHDFDEYFVILDGEARIVVGDVSAQFGPGDGVAIGMGYHHDIPDIQKPLRAVFVHGELEGAKRPGHLWNHRDGQAVPDPERVQRSAELQSNG